MCTQIWRKIKIHWLIFGHSVEPYTTITRQSLSCVTMTAPADNNKQSVNTIGQSINQSPVRTYTCSAYIYYSVQYTWEQQVCIYVLPLLPDLRIWTFSKKMSIFLENPLRVPPNFRRTRNVKALIKVDKFPAVEWECKFHQRGMGIPPAFPFK